MNNPSHIEQIFFAALERATPQERADYLEAACAGDPALRQEVERLLAAHPQAEGFLEAPVAGLGATSDAPKAGPGDREQGMDSTRTRERAPQEMIGTWIGPYRLLQQLGEGGMGTVYLAEQEQPVKRRVALKVIKVGMDSAQVIARFEQERQALAVMEHPNIAKVLDAGATDAGRPFFVMELVKGVPITQYCDQAHLTPAQRLELFLPVCQAVQHAHQKGIIHRDLKPSNVLVALYDGQPVPKVIDFGVAKATHQKLTERTMFTDVGSIVGTIEYMAPEQAELNNLDIDTRADIYSLGVLLYELLTGSPPFTGKQLRAAAFTEMLRMIREQEPPKPSTKLSSSDELPTIAANRTLEPKRLTTLVTGELDWIVMKCLEKERSRRYETANALGMELQRYLADEPVLAGPPSARYRLKKFLRRNKGPAIAAAVVLLTLTAGIVGTTWGLFRAEAAWRAEAEQRDEAEQANQRAVQALRSFTDELMEKQLAAKTSLTENEKSILRNALRQWEVFAESKGNSATAHAIRADGAFNVARVQSKLGQHADAETNFRAAVGLYEQLAAEFPVEPTYRYALATAQHDLAVVLHGLGNRREAEGQYRQALAVKAKLVADFPAVPEYRYALAFGHNGLGALAYDLGKPAEAEQEFREALAIRIQLAADFPTRREYRSALAANQDNLGMLLEDLGKWQEAEEQYRQAVTIQKRLTTDFPAVPDHRFELATSHNNLGHLLLGLGRQTDAEREYREALTLRKQLVADFPAVPTYRKTLADTHQNLGIVLKHLGKPGEAEQEYREGLAIDEKLAAESPTVPERQSDLASSHNALGSLLYDVGKPLEAEQQQRQALAVGDQLLARCPAIPEYRDQLATAYNDLGLVLADLGKPTDAEQQYQQAVAIRERLVSELPDLLQYQVNLGGTCCNIGTLLSSTGRPADSLEWFDKAVRALSTVYKQDPQSYVAKNFLRNSYSSRAMTYALLKQYTESAEDWNRAIELSPPEERLTARSSRAASLVGAGQIAEAIREVDELTKSNVGDANLWYNCACIYALASGKDVALKDEYATRAVQHLAKAIALGWNDADHIVHDTDLDSLRDRSDFQQLLESLPMSKPDDGGSPASTPSKNPPNKP